METKESILKIVLNTRIKLREKKYFNLNMNNYRNVHFRDLHKAKKLFARETIPLLKGIEKMDRIKVEYHYYPNNRRRCDVNNVLSIVDKFFLDCLVEAGVIEDDNYMYITDTNFRFGGVDKDSRFPYVIAEITEITPDQQSLFHGSESDTPQSHQPDTGN